MSSASPASRALAAVVALLIAGAAPRSARAGDELGIAGPPVAPARPTAPPQEAATNAPARPLRLVLSTVGYTDKAGIYFVEPRLVGGVPVPLGAELRIGGSYTDAGLQLAAPATTAGAPAASRRGSSSSVVTTGAPGRSMAGAALSVPWSIVRATLGYAVYLDSQSTVQDGELAVSVKPLSALELGADVRHRPFVEMAEPLATDEQAFYTAGPAGAMDLLAAWPLTVNEGRLTAKLSPVRWAYLYGDARRMAISDGNHGWTASAGAGVSLASLVRPQSPVDVSLRWDTWAAAYSAASAAYYSPSSVVTHSPGLELRLRQAAFELAAEGGVTLAPGQSFTGTFWGGSALLRLGRVSLAARAQARSDPWFASRKAWVGLQTEL